jgi:predicted TIM-barrel fold metal-dependent hydrolase
MGMIDVHSHVFSKDALTLGGKILLALGDLVTNLIGSAGDYEHAENNVSRINAFIEMSGKDPSELADRLFQKYGKQSIIVPLMYDMYYLTHDVRQDFSKQVDEALQRFDAYNHPDEARAASLKDSIVSIGNKVKEEIANDALESNSFDIQLQDLIKLKGKFGKSIYPFMSFDPRRSGNLDKIKANVGPDKDFRGVKLYTPLGFSAAHPLMMDKQNGLYAYCVANDIPITAHCSCPGMTTMNDHLYVPHDSWVFDAREGKPVKLTMDEVVDFSGVKSEVKSQYFNHPEIWRIVLNEFPSLRLNLAHFGGDHNSWRDTIADMINSNMYQNLYTDVSCRTDPEELKYIRAKYDVSDAIKRRLMYGSDFTILLLYDDLASYSDRMGSIFPIDKDEDVYYNNIRRFLKLQLPD